jgi:hypothetical protein
MIGALEMLELEKDKDKEYYKAICISEKLWEWLADNPDKSKIDFPNFEKYGINYMPHFCSLCAYREINDSMCEACIVNIICDDYSSYIWGSIDERQEFALKVWRKCLDERLRIMEWHV